MLRHVKFCEGGGSDFQCMLKVEKSIVWHGKGGGVWNAPNASIVAGHMVHFSIFFDQSASDGYHFKDIKWC
jgi:hypothetical protein